MVHETINYKLLAIKNFVLHFLLWYRKFLKLVQIFLNNTGNFEVGIENFGNLQI